MLQLVRRDTGFASLMKTGAECTPTFLAAIGEEFAELLRGERAVIKAEGADRQDTAQSRQGRHVLTDS